jgi:hypothetical protein
MSSLIRWMFNAGKTTDEIWWKDMSVDVQVLCERHLQSTHKGDSKIHFCRQQVVYSIDMSVMTQQNLTTGRLRTIKRSEMQFIRSGRQEQPWQEVPAPPDSAHGSFREPAFCRDSKEDHRKWRRIESDKR